MRLLLAALLGAGILVAQPAPPQVVILLIGPPASGKSTQAGMITKRYGLPVVSDVELRQAGGSTEQGMSKALKERLSKFNAAQGFILDGYPETRGQMDFFFTLVKELKLPKPLVVQIDVPDAEARRRAMAEKADMKRFETQLNAYHRELELARQTFTEPDIWVVNGQKTPQQVFQTIQMLMQDRLPQQ
jgi:adenylate kinase